MTRHATSTSRPSTPSPLSRGFAAPKDKDAREHLRLREVAALDMTARPRSSSTSSSASSSSSGRSSPFTPASPLAALPEPLSDDMSAFVAQNALWGKVHAVRFSATPPPQETPRPRRRAPQPQATYTTPDPQVIYSTPKPAPVTPRARAGSYVRAVPSNLPGYSPVRTSWKSPRAPAPQPRPERLFYTPPPSPYASRSGSPEEEGVGEEEEDITSCYERCGIEGFGVPVRV